MVFRKYKLETIRYNQTQTPTIKLGDKQLASYISPLLGLLYQPNKNSVEKIEINMDEIIDSDILTIYEKIGGGKMERFIGKIQK